MNLAWEKPVLEADVEVPQSVELRVRQQRYIIKGSLLPFGGGTNIYIIIIYYENGSSTRDVLFNNKIYV